MCRRLTISGRDSQLIPKTLKDFPDFNVTSAKSAVKEKLKEEIAGATVFKIHNVVICGYAGTSVEKTIIFQAALQYSEKVCEYCGSRLVNIKGNTWKFTEIYED